MSQSNDKSLAEWQAQLTPEAYAVCRLAATERPFTGKYNKFYDEGTYFCVCCGLALFSSDSKYDSGSGWPSYFQPVSAESITEKRDVSHGMLRVEVCCKQCDAHLGHVFPDGPKPTGLRYCINSVALRFEPEG